MTTPQPVDPLVAAATAAAHLDDFFLNSPHVDAQWTRYQTGDPLQHVIGIPAGGGSKTEIAAHFVRLGFTHYDTWPPLVTFVAQDHHGLWGRARLGTAEYPLFFNSPGAPSDPNRPAPFAFALHDEYVFPDGRRAQLACFSYSLDYYTSNHAPTAEQRWRPGRDRLDATLNRLYRVLNSPAYAGTTKAAA